MLTEAEIDRRKFLGLSLKLSTACVVGVASDVITIPVSMLVAKEAENLSGHPNGNAGKRAQVEDSCKDAEDKEKCIQSYVPSNADRLYGIAAAPIMEESTYRALPSWYISVKEGAEEPLKETCLGVGGFVMTRREIIVGTISSVLFGMFHNFTVVKKEDESVSIGFDTKIIPASQTMLGLSAWYLQRKFGIFANMSAHAFYNFLALR